MYVPLQIKTEGDPACFIQSCHAYRGVHLAVDMFAFVFRLINTKLWVVCCVYIYIVCKQGGKKPAERLANPLLPNVDVNMLMQIMAHIL